MGKIWIKGCGIRKSKILREKGKYIVGDIKTEWWLIPADTILVLQDILECAIEHVNEECGRTGCLCDIHGSLCSEPYSDALRMLDSSIHNTNKIPDEFLPGE